MEPKRISLTTINNGTSSNANAFALPSEIVTPGRFGADFFAASQSKQTNEEAAALKKQALQTMRFELELFEPDSTRYPSFNYAKLVAAEKKKQKKAKEKQNGFGSGDPFEENDDDVIRIAREMEKKYGGAYGGTGKNRNKKDDFCDIGMGYDESDSFIDNTEAYDEVVPEEVETIEGGFYINCGALEFKSLRPEKPPKTRTDDIIKMPDRLKKMIITSSSDSDESDTSEDDEDDENDEGNSESDDSNEGSSKSKDSSLPSSSTSTVKSLKSRTKLQKKKIKTKIIASSSNSPKPESDAEASSRKTTTIKDMLKAKRDKFLKHQNDGDSKTITIEIKDSSNKTSENESSNDDSSDSEESDSSSNGEEGEENSADKNAQQKSQESQKDSSEKLRTTDTKLPDLDEEVRTGIHQFRDMVKALSLTGKKFQFSENLKDLFLRIDESLLCVEKAQRNMVFAHLEFHLSLPKYYFLRKAKQLRIKEEKQKTSKAIDKLVKAITETMPQSFANYSALKNAVSGADSDQLTVTPKKKFIWNNSSRSCLYEVYQVRWTSYPVLGTRKLSLEEFISGFMKSKIVKLWPDGWMCYEELQKEIEKQKNSMKKSKMKEKANNAASSSNSSSNVNSTVNLSKDSAAVTISATATSTTYNYKTPNPNFGATDDVENRNSQQNVACSTNKALSLKRKNSEALLKPSKSKAQKLNTNVLPNIRKSEPGSVLNQRQSTPVDLSIESISPPKKLESKISVVSTASLTYSGMTNYIPQATASTSSLSSSSNQHSKHLNNNEPRTTVTNPPAATHIIDLDNYTTTSEILKTTKKLAAARVSMSSANQKAIESDDNDCVEFVGVIPASSATQSIQPIKLQNQNQSKPKSKKSQGNSARSTTPKTASPFNTFTSDMASIYAPNVSSASNAQSVNDLNSMMGNIDPYKVIKSLEEYNRNYINKQNSLTINPLYTGPTSTTSNQSNKQKPQQ